MDKKELFNFGDKLLNVEFLLNNINLNAESYLNYYSDSILDSNLFNEKVNYIKEGIQNGSITTNGTGIYYDSNGKLSKDDQLMSKALHYVDTIAKAQSKKTRSLTQSEIDLKKQKLTLIQPEPVKDVKTSKRDFDPENPFNFEYSFKSLFGPSLEIPYSILKQTITKGADGKEDYTILKTQFQKAFNSMRNQLNGYNNSEQYITQVNDLETALFDGVWDHNDELAIHQAGLNKDLNSLKELFTYKLPEYNPRQNYKQNVNQVINPGDFTVIDGDLKKIIYLDESGKLVQENITDDEYYKLSGTSPLNVTDNTNPNPNSADTLDDLNALLEEDQLGFEVIGPIIADIYSIASPEPWTATGAGLFSDIVGIHQDIKNKGDFHWGLHAFNIGATIAGAIPYIGDAGNVGKVGSKIVNASLTINKFLGKTSEFLSKIPKQAVKTTGTAAGVAGLSWAYLDLTDEDSVILEQSKKALEAIQNGLVTAENLIAIGNGLAIALQVRKGWKKFRSLDPSLPKPKSTNNKSTSKPKPTPMNSYRDALTKRIKKKNSNISQEDINAIQGSLDKLSNKGLLARARLKVGGQSKEYLDAQKLLREKGHFTEAEIEEILKQIMKHKQGGILKASIGMQVPWRLNFDGNTHQMDNIYKLFTENSETYDAKQLAETLNKLNSGDYTSLNFENQDNTLGFKDWNITFNESGLNNLFGYNENKIDYLGVTTRSRNDFLNYLKTKGSLNTGNGNLSWNSESNQWEYKDWVDKSAETLAVTPEGNQTTTGTAANVEAPKLEDLTLKDLNIQKPIDWNPHGVLNSLTGYFANEAANAKKHEILKEIPLYLEVMDPEKAFKTAYTYDLEKSKNEILAEANNIQPITSDAATYYAAKNDAIKNARAYTTKLDTEINNRIQLTKDANSDIAYENAVKRTENVNTNAKYRHEWDIEQKQGEIDYIDARNQSFLGLNKELKHYHVTDSTKNQKETEASMYKHLLTGIMTSPSNYINGWTKHHDLIWFKGQNGQLETEQELIEYQQLLSLVNQASSTLFDLYNNIKYPGIGQLHALNILKESYDPTKHGKALHAKKGMKIDKLKIGNYINKLK